MADRGMIHTGTSGWSYKHWKGVFYPEDLPDRKMLGHYFGSFRTVEINSSFYRLPLQRTFEKWRDSAPEDFVFAVKASRYITHVKRLRDCGQAVENFFERAAGLGEKLGPVLFQLPPGFGPDIEKLDEFLGVLPPGRRVAFEFRHPGWFAPEVYSLLAQRRAAFCVYELAGRLSPAEITADFVYVRLHGPGGAYRGSYSGEVLSGWAERFSAWAGEGRDIYCYFDNDEKGFAVLNAIELRDLVKKSG